MESQGLLAGHSLNLNTKFLVRLRRRLLLLFWISFAAIVGVAVLQVVRAYHPPPSSAWYHRRAICSYMDLQASNKTADFTDHQQAIRGASLLGCGALLLRMADMGIGGQRLVTEGRRYDIRILLDIELEGYNSTQEEIIQMAVRRYIQDGVSGFSLVGGCREATMTVVGILQEELEDLKGDDRIVLLPDWLDENAMNQSHFLRTRPVPEGKPWEVSEMSEVMRTAWEVTPNDSRELQQFMAVTLPGTIKLSLSQTHPPPSWLRPLLLFRFQNPALYAGWLETLSDNSSFSVLRHWGCSTLLTTINPSNQSQVFSLHLPHYMATAQLLLSTLQGRAGGKLAEDSVLLAPGEAQLLRLRPQD